LIELDPILFVAYKNRAYLYKQMGERQKAQADEKTAETIENAPKD
jgi:hypothetical protein